MPDFPTCSSSEDCKARKHFLLVETQQHVWPDQHKKQPKSIRLMVDVPVPHSPADVCSVPTRLLGVLSPGLMCPFTVCASTG